MSSITLESTEASFRAWRAERNSRAELIPDNLWSMALELYPQYKRSNICRRLGLSGGQFKRRLEGNRPSFSGTGFVLASHDEVNVNAKSSHKVELNIQGKERTLTLCFDVDALPQIFPHIGALL
jgi:hypothetical protein